MKTGQVSHSARTRPHGQEPLAALPHNTGGAPCVQFPASMWRRVIHSAIAFVLWTGISPAPAATISTRDGRTLQGEARFDAGGLALRQVSGHEIRLDLSAIRHAVFRNGDAPSVAVREPQRQVPSEKPAELRGLRAEYYIDTNLQKLGIIRIDPKVEFWWSDDESPDPAIPTNFSVRWTGQITPEYSETYTFHVDINDGTRLWIDGRLIIDSWHGGPKDFSGTARLVAGRKHDIRLEFRDLAYSANARLGWSSDSQPRQIVPPERLSPPPGTVPPRVRLAGPADGSTHVAVSELPIEADPSDPDGRIARVEFYADGHLLGTAGAEPWRFGWKQPSPGLHRLHLRAFDDAGIMAQSEAVEVVVAADGAGTLPRPWMELPVGTLSRVGRASLAAAQHRLQSSGADFWTEHESFHFVCRPLAGDGSIIARLDRFQRSDPVGAVAGIMIREHLGKKARMMMLGYTPDEGLLFVRRENGYQDRVTQSDGAESPLWLKLTRHGDELFAQHSADGARWQTIGQRRIALPDRAYVGLVIACPGQQAGHAVFDEVQVIEGEPEMASTARGVLLRGGTFLAGDVRSVDDTLVRISHRGRELRLPTSQVARVLVRPLPAEAVRRVRPGQAGVILSNGDFIDGAVTYHNGRMIVGSVLFGVREFNTHGQTVAAVLRDVEPAPCAFIVRCADNSVYRAGALVVEADRLLISDGSGQTFPVAADELVEIRAE